MDRAEIEALMAELLDAAEKLQSLIADVQAIAAKLGAPDADA